MPTYGEIEIWQGNNSPPVIWEFPLTDLTGWSAHLTVRQNGDALIEETTAGDLLSLEVTGSGDALLTTVTWNYSLAQSRLLPLGRSAVYELEFRSGLVQQTLVYGPVVVGGGVNSDD